MSKIEQMSCRGRPDRRASQGAAAALDDATRLALGLERRPSPVAGEVRVEAPRCAWFDPCTGENIGLDHFGAEYGLRTDGGGLGAQRDGLPVCAAGCRP